MFGLPYFGSPVRYTDEGKACCPLCGLEDSGTHIMGGCTHQTMHKLYVSRHNRAVNLIREALSKGSMSGSVMLMDACRQDQLPEGVVGTGTSIGLLLTKAPGATTPSSLVRTSKPDLVVLHGVSSASWQTITSSDTSTLPVGMTLSLFEVGYCQDTLAMQRREEKHQQHQDFVATLLQHGYKVEYPLSHCIMLGHGGTVLNHLHNLLVKEGVPQASIKKVVAKLAINAVESEYAILTQRRILEAKPCSRSHNNKRRKQDAG